MIAFKDNLPLVRLDDGRIVAFEKPWLSRSLAVAAVRAGYQKWWLAEHVTQSVASFLEQDFDGPVVGVARLRTAVCSVLQVIGYGDVAHHFEPLPPTVRVSLADLAREAGTGYELAFFGLLRDRLREVVDSSATNAEFVDLARCVKMLRGAKYWRSDCRGLRSEIVRFVQGELSSRDRPQELHFQLS